MRRRSFRAACPALRANWRPTAACSPRQQAVFASLLYRLPLLRSMSNVGSAAPPSSSDQYRAVPQSVAASSPQPSSTAPSSLLSVCVDGLCSRRLNWDELVVLVGAGRLEALGRLDWQLVQYGKSKAVMLREYHSVTDRLRDVRLAAPCRLEDGRKRCDWTQQSHAQQMEPSPPGHPMRVVADDDGLPMRVCWWENEFGYAIDSGIGHHLLWSDRYLSPDSRLFQRLLSEHRLSNEFEVLTFINPLHLRSIPDLQHIHVFSRPRRKERPNRDERYTSGTYSDKNRDADKQ